MDGYHVSHDPAKPFTKEPTTGRQLNILDVPKAAAAKRQSAEIPTGRGISPSRIACPKPSKPYASRKVREADLDELSSQLERAELHEQLAASPALSSAAGSDVSSRTGSSFSELSDASACRCNRYGITRKGDKVRLDCGGSRCGADSDDSSCCSESESESEDEAPRARQVRRAAPVAARRR